MNLEDARPFVVSVPWPVRLFGDLQYFLGLPAVSMALDLRTVIGAEPRSDGEVHIRAPWLEAPVSTTLEAAATELPQMPSLARVLKALRRDGWTMQAGFDAQVQTRAPWPEVVSDSAALVVAWTLLALAMEGRLKDYSGDEIASLAGLAFAEEEPHSRWTPEIYACIMGGTTHIEPARPPHTASIERKLPGLVIGRVQARKWDQQQAAKKTLAALGKAAGVCEGFDLNTISLEAIAPRLRELPDEDAGIAYAHLICRDICRQALELLEGEECFDDDRIGELLDGAHEMLRDYLGFSSPALESALRAALEAGALGGKALADAPGFLIFAPGRQDDVVASLKAAGADARPTSIGDGMRVDRLKARHS